MEVIDFIKLLELILLEEEIQNHAKKQNSIHENEMSADSRQEDNAQVATV